MAYPSAYFRLALNLALLLLWSVFISRPAYATERLCQEKTHAVDSTVLEALSIGRIYIDADDLFNTNNAAESRLVHKLANALHLVTREKAVLAALPFKTGDAFKLSLLSEGERELRSKRYIRDASVKTAGICGDLIDITVHTIDNWTLTPSVSFGSAGGDDRYTFELQDLNVLGYGKEIKLRQVQDGDAVSSSFLYKDDNIVGGRNRLRLELGDTEQGERHSIQGGLPFYSIDTPFSWWASVETETVGSTLMDNSEIELPVTTEEITITLTQLREKTPVSITRLGTGFRFAKQATGWPGDNGNVVNDTDFVERYPFLSVQWHGDRWIKKQNYESIRTNEDIDLGLDVELELGFLLGALKNGNDALRFELGLAKGWYRGLNAIHKLNYTHINYVNNTRHSKHAISAQYQYFRWLANSNQIELRLTGETQKGYSPHLDYSLGGIDGLRAYRTSYQTGEQRVYGMAEFRHVNSWSPFSLVHTAVTSFVEFGRAWKDDGDGEILADVGLGLMLSPTRGSHASLNRFEISVPLVGGEDVAQYQIFVGTKINY